jgi:predicted PurR-regulated permease PerM
MITSPQSNGIVKALLVTAALFIILAGIKVAVNIIVPFLLSAFIAIACNPLINKASRYKVPKALAVVLVIMLFLFIALSIAGLVGKSLTELSLKLPEYRQQLNSQFTWLIDKLAAFNIVISAALLVEYFDPAAAMGLATDM